MDCAFSWNGFTHLAKRVKYEAICVCEYVCECGQKAGAYALPMYSYTYSYTPISPFRRPLVYLTAMTVPEGGSRMYLS